MGNPFPNFSGGVVPEFRITATNSNHTVDFESVWGGTNLLYKHLSFSAGITAFYKGTSNDEVARFNQDKFGVGTQSPGQLIHTHSGTSSGGLQIQSNGSTNYIAAIQSAGNFANGSTAGGLVIRSGNGIEFSGNDGSSIQMRLASEGHLTLPNQPAFNAHRNGQSAIQMSSNSGTDVVFATEDFDNGNCYNTSNGRFTAPVAGKYFFGIQFYVGFSVSAVRVMHANWTKNGSIHAGADLFGGISNAGGTHYHPTVNAQIMMSLSENDYVTFRLGNMSTSGSGNTYLYGSTGTRFFGHLVA